MELSAAKADQRPSTAKSIFLLLKQTVSEWSDDNAPRLGAALAYYTVFSLAPLILIAILIAGLVFSNAEAQVLAQVKGLVGGQGEQMIQSMVEAARKPVQTSIATILAFATLLFGAAGVFVQLKNALNTIWNVPPSAETGVRAFIRKYFLSFTVVLGIGFLLLVSLLLEAGLAIIGEYLKGRIPGMGVFLQVLGVVVSFGIITALFAMLFKFLPDTEVPWRDVWIGALLTAGLFVVGKLGLGVYLGKASVASAYGAAGSLVLILLWVYYSAQILFFGAEFTQVYSHRHGSRCPRPRRLHTRKEHLVAIIERDRERLKRTTRKVKKVLLLPESTEGTEPPTHPRFKL